MKILILRAVIIIPVLMSGTVPAFALQIDKVQAVSARLSEEETKSDVILPDPAPAGSSFLILSSETSELKQKGVINERRDSGGEGPGLVSAYYEDENLLRVERLRADSESRVSVRMQGYSVQFKDGVKVQSGTTYFSPYTYEKEIIIETVVPEKSMVLLNTVSDDYFTNQSETAAFMGSFKNDDILHIERYDLQKGDRYSNAAVIRVDWQVVEFSEGVRITHGKSKLPHYVNLKEEYLYDEKLPASNRAFLVFTFSGDEKTDGREKLIQVRGMLQEDEKTLRFSKAAQGVQQNEQVHIKWTMVELENPSSFVQRGREKMTAEEKEKRVSIEPIDLTRAFPLLSVSGGADVDKKESADALHHIKIRAELTDSETLVFSRYDGTEIPGSEVEVRWHVVEFAPFNLASPNGGEVWKVGETRRIEWQHSAALERGGKGPWGTHLGEIRLSLDGGKDEYPHVIAAKIPMRDGAYNWTIPEHIEKANMIGSRLRIKLIDTDLKERNWDTSDADFAIKGSIELTAPLGREIWRSGETDRVISWNYRGNLESVSLLYDVESGFGPNSYPREGLIAYNIPVGKDGQGSYTWHSVAEILSERVRIKVMQESDPTVFDTSPNDFTVLPQIFVFGPPEDGSWLAQTNIKIKWKTTGVIELFNIYYRTNLQEPWAIVAKNIRGDKKSRSFSFDWWIPADAAGDKVQIKVEMARRNEVFGVTEPFRILPWMTVTSPSHGMEIWEAGKSYPITWKLNGDVEHVEIDYSADEGKTWKKIVTVAGKDGKFLWTVPNIKSDKALIRIMDVKDKTHIALSEKAFRLKGDLTLLRPNGGEKFESGKSMLISWSRAEGMTGPVDIYYSTDGGAVFSEENVVARSVFGDFYTWDIPDQFIAVRLRLRVVLKDSKILDDSDQDIIVLPRDAA